MGSSRNDRDSAAIVSTRPSIQERPLRPLCPWWLLLFDEVHGDKEEAVAAATETKQMKSDRMLDKLLCSCFHRNISGFRPHCFVCIIETAF